MNNQPPLAHKAVHVLISGRVQGVGYRAWTERTARKLGLSGWVRNCIEGEVEAVFSGDPDAIEAMITACHKGAIAAKVSEVSVREWQESVSEGFIQLPSV